MQWVKKYWHKTRKFLEENFLVSVLVLLLLQVLLLMRFEKMDMSWSALSATAQPLLLISQCVILYRQNQIMHRQADISTDVAKMPMREKIFGQWLDALDDVIKALEAQTSEKRAHNSTALKENTIIKNKFIIRTKRVKDMTSGPIHKKIDAFFNEKEIIAKEINEMLLELPSKSYDSSNTERINNLITRIGEKSSEVIKMFIDEVPKQ
nr:hypothetical protein [uncultured Dethiosulfovibrio sp.]